MATIIYKKFFKKDDEAGKKAKTYEPCLHRSENSVEKCSECKVATSQRRKYRWKIIFGLFLPYTLQALDATIIASALPWIASDFGKTAEFNWIVSAFNLTSAAFIPCWAQMTDVFGRNASLNAAIIFMLIGSALCTGAPTSAFPVLLLGRGFQGMAAAGLNVCSRTIIADKVSLKENAKTWSLFALTGGISYAIGPVIGGFLTNTNWRWCFGINLPVGAAGMIVLFFLLRKELLGPQPIPELDETAETGRRTRYIARVKTIDFGGQLLFIFAFGLIILALTWGGVTYAWNSAAVLVSLIIGVLLVVIFFIWESQLAPGGKLNLSMPWQKPMIPWHVITHRDVAILFYCECINGVGMYAVLYFCNIYFIAVEHFTSDKAGVQLLYFTPGIGVGVYLCIFLCNRWPRMTWPPIFLGITVELCGIAFLALVMYQEKKAAIYGMMALVGAGTGLRFMAAPLHGIGIFGSHRAVIIALMSLAIPFGGTIGLTIMSTVFNNTSGLNSKKSDFSKIQGMGHAAAAEAVHNAKMGVVWAFVAITPLVFLAWVAALFLGSVKLGDTDKGGNADGSQNTIYRGPFFFRLLTGRLQTVQHPEIEQSHRKFDKEITNEDASADVSKPGTHVNVA